MSRIPLNKVEQKARQDALLALVPTGTKKVQVKDELGQLKYKPLGQIAESDEIQVKKDGTPVVQKGQAGRRPIPVVKPTTPINGALVKMKHDFIEKDPIFASAKENPDDPDVLHQVVLGLTNEAASLAFEREEAERKGEETSNISIRRVNALKAVGDTWLKRKDQMVSRGVDLESASFRTILKFIMETFRSVMEDISTKEEMIETVFSQVAKRMGDDDWVNEAKNRMKAIV